MISALIFFQSCSVYHNSISSADQAIAAQSKVKITVPDNDPYILKRLERHDGVVYGLANTNSSTYQRLRQQVKDHDYEGKYALILMQEQDLKNIHEKNTGASTAINISVPLVAIAVAAAIAGSNVSVDPGF